ncbi:MAG: hypothetical protein AAF919_02790 [Pseudomonadota bacterium]
MAIYFAVSFFQGRFISPFSLVQLLAAMAVVSLAMVVIWPNAVFLVRSVWLMVVGRDIGSASLKARNGIYAMTLSILLLRKHGAIEGIAALLPLPTLGSPDLIGEAVALVLVFLWSSLIVHRFFDVVDLAFSDEHLFSEEGEIQPIWLAEVSTALITVFVNVALPVLLTIAVFAGLDEEPVSAVLDFTGFILSQLQELGPTAPPTLGLELVGPR